MKKPIFSVIMPCYNSQDYVRNAIESITRQTYGEIELVVINDGSTDATLEILESYAKNDSRIKILSKENGGYATAVNVGLDNITGDYFCFIGSDDSFDRGLFQAVYDNIRGIGTLPDFIAFRTVMYVNNQKKGVDSFTDFDSVVFSDKTAIKAFSESYPAHSGIFSIKDTSKLYKTSLLKELRYSGKTGFDADGIFSMLFSHRAESFLAIPYDGYLWNVREDSVSSSVSLEKNIDRINNWHYFCDELMKLDSKEITKTEVYYSSFGIYILKDISEKSETVLRYYRFIKENAKFFIKVLSILNPGIITTGMKMLAVSPVLYCITAKIKK